MSFYNKSKTNDRLFLDGGKANLYGLHGRKGINRKRKVGIDVIVLKA